MGLAVSPDDHQFARRRAEVFFQRLPVAFFQMLVHPAAELLQGNQHHARLIGQSFQLLRGPGADVPSAAAHPGEQFGFVPGEPRQVPAACLEPGQKADQAPRTVQKRPGRASPQQIVLPAGTVVINDAQPLLPVGRAAQLVPGPRPLGKTLHALGNRHVEPKPPHALLQPAHDDWLNRSLGLLQGEEMAHVARMQPSRVVPPLLDGVGQHGDGPQVGHVQFFQQRAVPVSLPHAAVAIFDEHRGLEFPKHLPQPGQ